MANKKKLQEEVMASIDAAKAMVDKVSSILNLILVNPSLSLSFETNPIAYLLQLLQHLGVSRDDLEKWLTNFLIYVVPVLETSVKAILLTNLKKEVSCTIDPRIPEKYRKKHKAISDYNTSQEYGIDINIESIDYLDKLSVNPLSEYGSQWYFGLEGIEDTYKFARAIDMDAFLWYVIHKGKYPNAVRINKVNDFINGLHTPFSTNKAAKITPTNGTLLSSLDVMYETTNPSSILLGNTFVYNNGHVLSMCIDLKRDGENKIVSNTLVPLTDDWASTNWYASPKYINNLGIGKINNTERDYSKEKAIFNLQYIDQASSTSPITGLVNNKFRFTILPKPYIYINEKMFPPFKKMLFNDKGAYDPKGKYTFNNADKITEKIDDKGVVTFTVGDTKVKFDTKANIVTVDDKEKLASKLMECYPGLTVYEFNFDYIMGMRLFDAKVIASTLIESLLDIRMGVGVNISPIHQEGTETIKEIVKNILESDDSSVNDCYYTFDNTKYEALLRRTAEKKANRGNFQEIIDILNEYDDKTELHEQVDVLHRAITQAAVTVSEGIDDVDKYKVEFNFIFDLINALVTALTNAILSPKLLMLLEVNQQLMGGTWEKFTLKDLLKALKSIISAVVREIRDMVIQELLKLIMKELGPIIELISSMLIKEQLDSYSDAILEIIRNCAINPMWPNLGSLFRSKYQNTVLDTVDYADIDANNTSNNDQPLINNC